MNATDAINATFGKNLKLVKLNTKVTIGTLGTLGTHLPMASALIG